MSRLFRVLAVILFFLGLIGTLYYAYFWFQRFSPGASLLKASTDAIFNLGSYPAMIALAASLWILSDVYGQLNALQQMDRKPLRVIPNPVLRLAGLFAIALMLHSVLGFIFGPFDGLQIVGMGLLAGPWHLIKTEFPAFAPRLFYFAIGTLLWILVAIRKQLPRS